MSNKVIKSFAAKRNKRDEDYTEIKLGEDGNIVVEFRVWDDSRRKHNETALRLMPEEAHLLAKMLLRSANGLTERAAARTEFTFNS